LTQAGEFRQSKPLKKAPVPAEMGQNEFCKRLSKIEPTIDLAHDVTGCGRFAEVTETSDGYFLGRERGDIGFNAFLGQPSPRALENTKRIFDQLDDEAKVEFCWRIMLNKIRPQDINVNCSLYDRYLREQGEEKRRMFEEKVV
jgi:hypothetical protein